jgi:hypothetical protein
VVAEEPSSTFPSFRGHLCKAVARLKYQDFRLQIEAGPAASYTIHAQSPRGEGWAPFVPPFRPERAAELRTILWRSTRDLAIQGGADSESLDAIGERLFTSLFPGQILGLYERSLDLLEADPEAGLRLKLVFSDPSLVPFQVFPWELLRQPGKPGSLALSRRQPIVRYLTVAKPVYAARRPSVLRIVAVAASPRHGGLSSLDLARELRHLQEAVGSVSVLDLVIPRSPTLAALRQTLLAQECHVLHFMGHGGIVEGQVERVLFFETEDGNADPVRGTDLFNKLADRTTLRLAVLNACGSATLPSRESAPAADVGFDPFAEVANTLVLGGMPAVVAMQFPISDQAAIAFSRAFYQRLAAGDPVDTAVTEGRQAIHSADRASFEWATPVLFMRTPNGELYPKEKIDPPWEPKPGRKRWAFLTVLLLNVTVGLGLFGLAHFGPKTLRASRAALPPERPIEVTLHEDGPATLLSEQDSLAVHFNQIEQERIVTVSVNNESQAVLSTGAHIVFRRYSAHVLEINPANRSVRLRVVRTR